MTFQDLRRIFSVLSVLAATGLAGCATTSGGSSYRHLSSRDCLARVMYFESNRSSEDGMLAVGTVVMNRLHSGKYPGTVCGVVGQRNQFADGALYKSWSGASRDRAYRVADAVLAGQRHPGVGSAMFFHTAGYHYPYKNMHYVVVAGGNAFYEKRYPGNSQPAPAPPVAVAVAVRAPAPVYTPPAPVMTASNEDLIPKQDRLRLSMFIADNSSY
jgi:spore germination cell wall hydrolase CwlJ-like protein